MVVYHGIKPDSKDDGIRFRDDEEAETSEPKKKSKQNETEDIWADKSLGMHERISAAAARLADNHAEDKALRSDAVAAINRNLSNLRKAMSLQKKFDKGTVKRVADLARVLIQYGYIDNASSGEMKRLQKLRHGKENFFQMTEDITRRSELKLGEFSDAEVYRAGKGKKRMPDTGQQLKETVSATVISSIPRTKILEKLDETSSMGKN